MEASTKISAQLIEDLGLNWTADQREAYLANIKVVELPRLGAPPSIDDYLVTGAFETDHIWGDRSGGEQPRVSHHGRGLWEAAINFDVARLQYIAHQHESVIFRDAETKETVLVVLREFIADEAVRDSITDACREVVRYHGYNRRESPCALCGYICGLQHPGVRPPAFPAYPGSAFLEDKEVEVNNEARGMAGNIWNLMKSRFPVEVTRDYNSALLEDAFPCMDMIRDGNETFTLKIQGENILGVKGLRIPQLSAAPATLYAQRVYAEVNENAWVIACVCNAPYYATRGGNFYLASHGIMVLPADNTASAWRVRDHQGTSLYKTNEGPGAWVGYTARRDESFNPGLVFEISKEFGVTARRSPWFRGWPEEEEEEEESELFVPSENPVLWEPVEREETAEPTEVAESSELSELDESSEDGEITEPAGKKRKTPPTRYSFRPRKISPVYDIEELSKAQYSDSEPEESDSESELSGSEISEPGSGSGESRADSFVTDNSNSEDNTDSECE